MIERFQPTSTPPSAGPYSAGMKVGNLLFLAGQGPFDANGERVGRRALRLTTLSEWRTPQEHH